MKTIIPALLCALILVSSCKKSNDNSNSSGTGTDAATVSFTIDDGKTYKKQQVTINSVKGIGESVGTYFTKWNFTSAYIGDQPGQGVENKNRVSLFFEGQKTGTQDAGKEFANDNGPQTQTNFLIELTDKDGNQSTFGFDLSGQGSSTTPGSINITAYGSENGSIEGDFSGQLMNVDTGKFVTITNGHFKVPRGKNVN